MRRKIFGRIVSGSLAALLVIGGPATGATFAAQANENEEVSAELAADEVAIDEATFPDANFRAFVSEKYDDDGNGSLSTEEIKYIYSMTCSEMEISDFTGIEVFYNLTYFTCRSNNLTSLDVSKNTKLESLDCAYNSLTSIDLSKNTNLKSLYIWNNNLTSLDISNNTQLKYVYCFNNNITTLDVSNNSELDYDYCDFGSDVTFITGESSDETGIAIDETTFPDENFRNYVSEKIDTNGDGKLSESEIKNCYSIDCKSMEISDLTGIELFYNITSLTCRDNNLTKLDVSKNTELQSLDFANNQVTDIDLSNNVKITGLYIWNNKLTSLDVSKNTELKYLYCSQNNLTTVDLSNNSKIADYSCGTGVKVILPESILKTQLAIDEETFPDEIFRKYILEKVDTDGSGTLSDSEIKNCTSLSCYGLGISDFTGIEIFYNLTSLVAGNNSNITNLDVSKNTNLQFLNLYNDQLTSLDISKNTKLKSLFVRGNLFTSLDLSNNPELMYITADNNKLTVLDISNNPKVVTCSVDDGVKVITEKSDTEEPDTEEPTTEEPTTEAPTTEAPTTEAPTTEAPTTEAPTTEAPTTEAPTTEEPTTEAPTTEEPTTEEPTTEEPTTEEPTTEESAVELKQPALYTPLNTSTGGTLIRWTKSQGAAGYYVYRRSSGEKWSKIATVSGVDQLSYNDTKVENGKLYAYTVSAYYDDYESSYDQIGKGIKVMTQPNISKLTNVAAGIQINWNKSTGATGYYVYRRVSGGGWARVGTITNANTLTFTDKTAVAGVTYAYTVRAFNGTYVSSYNKTGKGVKCLKATTVKLSAAKGKTVVSWTKSAGAKGYYIYRKTGTGNWVKIATISNGSTVLYTDNTTKAGTKYYYAIKAYYGGYTSPWSNIPGITGK